MNRLRDTWIDATEIDKTEIAATRIDEAWIHEAWIHETWRDIPGYERLYQVSDMGRVRSLPRISLRGHQLKGGILEPIINKRGRPRVTLHKDGNATKWQLSHLVAAAFLGPRPSDIAGRRLWVLHWDDDASNNHLSNLRYGTPADNRADGIRNGRTERGKDLRPRTLSRRPSRRPSSDPLPSQ